MWTCAEDARRYDELDGSLQQMLRAALPAHGDQPVASDDLALYLEWMGLAREAATIIAPFVEKSSPFSLGSLSYRQLDSDFRSLSARIAPSVDAARSCWQDPAAWMRA